MQKFIIKDTEGVNLYVAEARSFKEAVEEALQSLGHLRGADLSEAYLVEVDLVGADLRGAVLRGANLEEADLTGASLRGADLTGTNLELADLRKVDLVGADLRGAYLSGASLRGADLTGANLSGASLRGADLTGANLGAETTATPSLSELESKIVLWAKEKGITKPDNAKNQFLKTVEETGELASALAKNDLEEVKDSVGDIIVTLIILAEIKGFSATEALANVYDIISKRTGKTVGGVFIKDE